MLYLRHSRETDSLILLDSSKAFSYFRVLSSEHGFLLNTSYLTYSLLSGTYLSIMVNSIPESRDLWRALENQGFKLSLSRGDKGRRERVWYKGIHDIPEFSKGRLYVTICNYNWIKDGERLKKAMEELRKKGYRTLWYVPEIRFKFRKRPFFTVIR